MGRFIVNFYIYILIFKTLAFSAIGTPSYIYATDEKYDAKIWLQWGGVSGATYYDIYYKEPDKTTFSIKKFTVTYEGSIYSETFYTTKEGIYTFKVRACDSSECGSFTIEESGSIQPKAVPNDVGGVSASDGVYEDKISLTWNSVADTTSYKILIHLPSDDDGVYSITKTTNSNSYEYYTSIQGTFHFKVQACNDVGCGNESSFESGSIKASNPPTQKPTNLIATDGIYQDSIKITWSSVENVTYYKLFYKAPNSSNFEELTINDTFYYLETFIFGDYIFQLQGCNSDGCSPISDSEVGTIAEVVPSGTPTNLVASDGAFSDKIGLSWGSVVNATHYKIYIKVPEASTYNYEFSNANSFDYYTSMEGVHYFKVQACNGVGCSTLYSNENSGYIKVLPPTNPPTNISATSGVYSDKIKVSWSSVENTTSYELYFKEPQSSTYSIYYINVNSTFYDYETDIDGAYYFKLKACNSGGCSSLYSNEVSGSIKEVVLPNPPSGFSASKGTYKNKIYLEWSRIDDAKKYIIYYRAPNSNNFNSVTYDVVYDGTLYSYPFSTYTEGNYTFKIQSCNDIGCGEESGEITGYIQPAMVPEMPTNLKVTNEIYEDKIELNWEAISDTTYYTILIHKPSDESGVYSITKTSTINSYIYNTTEAGMHYFKVKACNDVGCSSLTSLVEGAIKGDTPPSKPLNLTATDGEYKNYIKLNWNKSEGATYYKLFVQKPNSDYYEIVSANLIDNFYTYETSIKGDFYFKIQACNSVGCSTYSDIDSGFIANLPPTSAPTNLNATKAYSDTLIKISWDSVNEATHYKLYIKKPNSNSYDYLFVEDTFYNYSTTLAGEYYFKVQACNGVGCSDIYSSEVIGYTKLETLSAPLNLQASKGTKEGSIDISWDKVENATYYKFFYKKPHEPYYLSSNYFTVANNYYNFSTTLDGNFYFRVKACNNDICSENYSNEDSGYIKIGGLSAGVQNLSATKGEYLNKIEINWDLIDGVNCYKLCYREPLDIMCKDIDFICFDSSEKSGYYSFETTKNGNYYFSIYPCLNKDNCGKVSTQTIGYIKEYATFSPTLTNINLAYSEYLRPSHFFIYLAKDEGLKSSDLTFYINNLKVTPLDIKDEDGLIVKLPFNKLLVGGNRVTIKQGTKIVDIMVNTTIVPFREAFENGGFSWSASGGIGKELKFEVEVLGVKIDAKAGISATLELTHKDGIDTVVIADAKEIGSLLYGVPIEDTLSAKIEATLFSVEGNILDNENLKSEVNLGNLEGGASCSVSHNIYPLNLLYPQNKEEIAMFLIPYIGQQIIPGINSVAQIGSQILKNQINLYKNIYITDCKIGGNASLVKGEVSIGTQKDNTQISGLSTNIKAGEYQKLNRTILISGSENGKNINLVRKYYNSYSKDGLKVLYFEHGIEKGEYIARVVFKLPKSVKYENLSVSFETKEVIYYLSKSDYNVLLSNLFDIDTFLNYQFIEPTLIQTKLNSSVDGMDLTLLKVKGAIGIKVGGELRYSTQNYESVLYELAYKIKDKSYTIYENSDKTFRDVDLSWFYGKDLIVESFKSIDKDKLNEKLESYLKSLIGDMVNVTTEIVKDGLYEIKDEANKQIAKIKSDTKESFKVAVFKVKNLFARTETLPTNLNNANLTFISDILAIEVDNENMGSEVSIYPQYGTLENTALFKYSTQKAKWEMIESIKESDFIKFNIEENGLYAIIKDFVSSENDIFSATQINLEPSKSSALTSNQLKTILNSVASNKNFEISLSDTFILSNENAIYGESPIEIIFNGETNVNGALELGIISNSYEGEATINIKSNEGYLIDTLKVYVIKENSLKPIENFEIYISLNKSDIVVGDSIDITIGSNNSYIDEDITLISPKGEEINSKSIKIDFKGEWSIIVKLQDINGFWHEEKLTLEVKSSTSTTLNVGWNLKGNPLSINLYTSDINSLFGDGEYWIYEKEWIKNPSMIKPLQGFWIKSKLEKVIKFEDMESLDEKFTPVLSGWFLMGVESETNLISLLYKFSANIIYTYQNSIWYNSNTNPNRVLNIGDGYWLKR